MNSAKNMLLMAAACVVALCVSTSAAQAEEFGITGYSTSLSSTQAGAAADFNLKFGMTKENPEVSNRPAGVIRDQIIELPAGLVGDPTAVTATCSMASVAPSIAREFCPPTSVAGVAVVRVMNPLAGNILGPFTDRIYRVDPYPGEVAAFAFTAVSAYMVRLSVTVDPSNDYRVRVSSQNMQAGLPLFEADVTMWGVPQEHQGPGALKQISHPDTFGGPLPASVPRRRFMSVPARCDSPLVTTMLVASWQHRTFIDPLNSEIPAPTGCELLGFSPSLEVKPEVSRTAAPSGYQVTLRLGQNEDPATPRTANLKDAVVTLPKGVAISPSTATGLEACTDAQLAIDSAADETCPAASKIGDVLIETPVLDHPVAGAVYAGSQLSGDPASGEMFRLFLTATDSGLKVKLRGQISVDPDSGQITARFLENPDLPVEKLTLTFKGGDRAPLTTPPGCGEHLTSSSFTSWGGQSVRGSSAMKIDQGCGDRGFTPALHAGTANPVAGEYSPFTLRVTKPDGQQNVSSIEATLPKGLLAKLAGIPLCADAQAATGDCPASSQVGTATVGAGGGATPVYVPQPGKPATAAYLAGPYKNAPYSLVVKVPAQAGPFDLGTVTVRNALQIDPVTTQVTAKSDPLPQIVKGVPITYRDIRVQVDRPGFTLNPTSCEPSRISARIGSSQGANANLSDRFQVGECGSLDFSPHLKLKVSGPTKRASYTKLRAELKALPGQANIGKVSVALPHSIFLAQEHIKTICTRVQYAAEQCPEGSVYGWARAFTPLLDQPLEGPVYLRSSSNQLPDLVASLDGQIHIDLAGRIDSANGGIRTTFEGVPDAPVSKFVLSMKGGKKSLLVNSRNLCAGVNRATVRMDGQNGKAHDFRPAVGNSCGKKAKKRAGKHRSK